VLALELALNFITQHGMHADRVLRARLEAWPLTLRVLFSRSSLCRARFTDFLLSPVSLRKFTVDLYATDVKGMFATCLEHLIVLSDKDPALEIRLDLLTGFVVHMLETVRAG
jgi:hypothetical protein